MDQLAVIEQTLERYRQLLDECYDDDTKWLEDKIAELEATARELLGERF